MYYLVSKQPAMPDCHEFGYESRHDFFNAVMRLARRYGGRIGECVATRHAFRRLRFTDTPDGRPQSEWLPDFMLSIAVPPMPEPEEDDPLAGIWGEGW